MCLFYTKNERCCSLLAPTDGKIISVYDIPDKILSSGAVGEGFAVWSSNNIVCAPVSGIISDISDGLNDYTITTEEGAEIFIRIGLRSDKLLGDGLRPLVIPKQKVGVGTPICSYDPGIFSSNDVSELVAVILINSELFKEITVFEGECRNSESVAMSFAPIAK